MIEFKKGDYVVLLKSCTGENRWKSEMPEGYCYKLSKDSIKHKSDFYVDRDNEGSNSNGWRANLDYDSKLELRHATKMEIANYINIGKPYEVFNLMPNEIENYNYIITLLNKLNIK